MSGGISSFERDRTAAIPGRPLTAAAPRAMAALGAVDAVEAVCAEEVALCPDDVGRAVAATVAVDVTERRRMRRQGAGNLGSHDDRLSWRHKGSSY